MRASMVSRIRAHSRTPEPCQPHGHGFGGGDQQERSRELQGAVDAIDGDGSLLERLAEALNRGTRELGELVEEQDVVVGERDLA